MQGAWTSPGSFSDAVASRAQSTMTEGWLALLDEGAHALLLVFEPESRMEFTAFEQQALGQRGFVGAIDRLLDLQHHGQRKAGDLLGDGKCLLHQFVGRNDP